MNKKLLIIIGIIVIAVVAIFAFSGRKEIVGDKPTVKIGVILPLSGDFAFAGVPVRDTINQALKDIQNSRDLKYNYKLFFEDNQNTPNQSLLQANRLKSVYDVNALLSVWSESGLVVSPFANKNKIIHIGCAWGYETATGAYAFNHATFPEEQAAALVKELKVRNIKSLGLIWDADKGNQSLVDVLLPQLKAGGIKVSFNEMINRGTTDFRTEISKMKKTDAEIMLLLMMPPGMNIFMKQKNEMKYDVPITSVEYFTFQPDLFEGYWYISDALGTPEFGKYIKSKTGHDLNTCMANMYDSLNLLINAYESTESLDNEQVAKALLSADINNYKSVTGKIFIDKDGNIHTETTLKKIQNGQPVIVKE